MNISLTKNLEQLIEKKVKSGLYRNPSDVVRDALRHLEDIFVFIGNNNLEAAHRFEQAAKSAFQFIAKHPGIGRERKFKAAPDLRSWRIRDFESHLIFFRPQEDSVEIVRVLHGARDLEKEFKSDV